jgi:hypothetical protein
MLNITLTFLGLWKKSHYNDSFQRVNSHKIIVVGHNTKNERSK